MKNSLSLTKKTSVITAFAAVGLLSLFAVRAGGVSISLQAENSKQGANVIKCDGDGAAREGGYVQLGTPSPDNTEC